MSLSSKENPCDENSAAHHPCRICGRESGNAVFVAREMMFGLRDEFDYIECAGCGCLQIAEAPADLSRYYPDDYYSFEAPTAPGPLKRLLKRSRTSQALGRRSIAGALLLKRFGIPPVVNWVRPACVGLDDAILDVGCGRGRLLLEMRACGFSNLTGIDPYVDDDLDYGGGLRVYRRALPECDGRFDLAMLHHAFEHMPDPVDSLAHIHRLLHPGGHALIRMPVAGTHAWRTYGTDWAQLDAPRHLFLHTQKSLGICANAAGFDVTEVIYDSTVFQFWASEQYRRDIPLRDERSYGMNPEKSVFSQEEIRAFGLEAIRLNQANDGDQACFYLRRRD